MPKSPAPKAFSRALGPCLLVALALLLGSCSKAFRLEASTLGVYASQGQPGLRLAVSRDGSASFGSWEEPALGRFGLLEGEAKADGTFSYRLYGASTSAPAGLLKGRYAQGEAAMEASLAFGSEAPSPLSLARLPEATATLRQLSLRGTTRKGLDPKIGEPTRFFYVGFEPTSPAAFRDWYKKSLQGNQDLKAAMAKEKGDFIGDFETVAAAATKDGGSIQPWFYDGRQLLGYANDKLLVMGLRRSVYAGNGDMQLLQSLRFAVIDSLGQKVLGPDDFLAQGWDKAILPLLAPSLREELGLDPAASLASAGMKLESPPPSKDFFVYSKGLGFHYPPGSIGPEEAGEFFILLPFDRLTSLLKPGCLAAYGLDSK